MIAKKEPEEAVKLRRRKNDGKKEPEEAMKLPRRKSDYMKKAERRRETDLMLVIDIK
ncbi:hypothetical protein JOC86_004958 [Bacillus pakistanensis]|uniref:Uncharacterized protein n=1 Tax=Rossellomorea pakistanensis TaxID=992288 RepID=A0ABS2NKH2_9BACI|nr:hypothetical protein [Bacillus pakistanensis]MBM7588360.1 hypothetical protein [Bacillus pakistanensis]